MGTVMLVVVCVLGYVVLGLVIASVTERVRRPLKAKCGTAGWICFENHVHGSDLISWLTLFLWPFTLVGFAAFYTVRLLIRVFKHLSPIKGADAIEAAEAKTKEVRKNIAERKKPYVLVEGNGETDS